jgi:hypothetical protein
MTKVQTVMPAILMLLWPTLGASESMVFSATHGYFYNSVMPPAEGNATEKPLATPSECLDPSYIIANIVFRTIAYEVNGLSWCGGNLHSGQRSTYLWFTLAYNYGTRVEIRYATRNTIDPFYNCSNQPMFLWLLAPAMGIDERYLDSSGQWSLAATYFRNAPPANVWSDLYFDYPPPGDYRLVMGCSKSGVFAIPGVLETVGEIRFKIRDPFTN